MATLPLPGNKCKGVYASGKPNRKFYCLKNLDSEGDPVYSCAAMRYFKVSCNKINGQCNSISGAWVAAATVCSQNLF